MLMRLRNSADVMRSATSADFKLAADARASSSATSETQVRPAELRQNFLSISVRVILELQSDLLEAPVDVGLSVISFLDGNAETL